MTNVLFDCLDDEVDALLVVDVGAVFSHDAIDIEALDGGFRVSGDRIGTTTIMESTSRTLEACARKAVRIAEMLLGLRPERQRRVEVS